MDAVRSFNYAFRSNAQAGFTQRRKVFASLRGTFFQGMRDTSDLVNRYLIEGDDSNEEADVSERDAARIVPCEQLYSSGSEFGS